MSYYPQTEVEIKNDVGNPIPVTGTITATVDETTLATSANQATANTSLSSIATNTTGVAKDGTDISAPTAMPTGGVGIRGWLSAIWTKLNGSINVTGAFYQATQPVSGTLAVTESGTWTVQPGNTANTTPWLVKNQAWSVASLTSLTTTATVSAAAGTFSGGSFINLNSAPAYVQCFDTTGAVTLGTTTPTFVQPIPANATAANGAAFVFHIPGGINLTNGLKVAVTTTATGATTVTTGLIGFITYR